MGTTIERYRHAVERVLNDYALPPRVGNITATIVHDPLQDRYLLMHIGWRGERRIHSVIAHIQLRDGKVLIEHDGMMSPPGLIAELIAAGIPEGDIVPAFWQPLATDVLASSAKVANSVS